MKAAKCSSYNCDNPKMVKGYAKGGRVEPAATMDGGVFYRAAQRAGLKTDNATLNRIIALVNQGYTVDRAAQEVANVKGYAFGGLVPRRPAPKRNEEESTKMSKPQLLGRKDMFK